MDHNLTSTGRVYAGIGSRDTPPGIARTMAAIAGRLAGQGWTVRHGGARGADQAFHEGALEVGGHVELYLPWPGYERDRLAELAGAADDPDGLILTHERPSERAYEIAARFHPRWDRLAAPARALLARDAHQVLGRDLMAPARMVICWTADGSLDGSTRTSGGTGQTLRIAAHYDVAVFNLARDDHHAHVTERIAA